LEPPSKDKKSKWWKISTKRSQKRKEAEPSGSFLEVPLTPSLSSLDLHDIPVGNVDVHVRVPAIPEIPSREEPTLTDLHQRLVDLDLLAQKFEKISPGAASMDGDDIISSYFSNGEEETDDGNSEDADLWTLREDDFEDEIAYSIDSHY
ncbi:hypothetical protein M422DRAFT_260989, partial [Sphaerobolus stellatus SS14]